MAAHVDGLSESLPHDPRAGSRGPRCPIGPLESGIITEPSHKLGQQRFGARGGGGPGIVRAPRHDALRISGATKIDERRVEHNHSKICLLPPWREVGAILPCVIGDRIELYLAPTMHGFRWESRSHVLPGKPRAPGGSLVERKTCGAFSQVR